jgi:hypothetical protein
MFKVGDRVRLTSDDQIYIVDAVHTAGTVNTYDLHLESNPSVHRYAEPEGGMKIAD